MLLGPPLHLLSSDEGKWASRHMLLPNKELLGDYLKALNRVQNGV